MKLFSKTVLTVVFLNLFSGVNMFGYQNHGHHCHNPNHNHNHSVNCPRHYSNNGYHHNHHHNCRGGLGFNLSFNTPTVYSYQPPVTIVEHSYYRPTHKIVNTYTRPAHTRTYSTTTYNTRPYGQTTVRNTYSSRPSVYQTETVYSRPGVVRETVAHTVVQPAVVQSVVVQEPVVYCETVEYRNHHPMRALTDFAGAMIDAFMD